MPVVTSEVISRFSPQNIPSLAVWLDAADSNTITLSGTTVTQWRDKSANAYVGGFTSGRNFTYASNIQNGLNCIQTDTGQSMILSNVEMLGSSLSIFKVYYPINQAVGSPFIEHGVNTNTTNGFFFHAQSNSQISIRRSTTQVSFTTATSAISNTWQLIEGISPDPDSNSRLTFYVNGTRQGSSATTTLASNATSNIFINGRNNTNTFSYPAYLAEIILYNRGITADERRRVEGYLMRKWGLLNILSTNNLYRTLPPVMRPFIPLDITGCALWLDAADFQTLTLSGSNVTTWRDKSGNQRNGTGYNNTATYNVNGLETGRPGLEFSSTKSMRSLISAGTFSTGVTGFVVYKFTGTSNASSTYTLLSRTVSSTTARPTPFDMYAFNGADFRLIGDGTTFTSNNTGTRYITNANPTVYSFWLSNSQRTTWNDSINGTAVTYTTTGGDSTAAYSDTGTSVVIGGRLDTGVFFQGVISEVIFYNRSLGSNERQQVELYLGQKWSLRSTFPPVLYSRVTPTLNPTTISNCVLWIDAGDSTSFTLSGNTLASITDKSPTAKTITVNSAPTYSNNAFNNRPGFVFASGNRLSATTPVLGRFATLIAVYRVTVNANSVPLAIGLSGSGNETGIGYNVTPFYNIYDFGVAESTNTAVQINNSDIIHVGVKASSNLTSFVNGLGAVAANSTYSNTNTTINLGGGSFPFVGPLAEALVYSRPITTTERQQIELYLAQKWGLFVRMATPSPLALYSSLSPLFNPTVIPGCSMWHDAADFGTLTLSGSNVSQWNDKSGNANHFVQATVSAQPTYTATTSTRLPAIYFATSSLFMSSVSNSPVTGNASRTLFVIMYSADTTNRMLVGTGPHTSATPPNTFGIDLPNFANILYAPYVYNASDNTFAVTLTGMQCLYAYYDNAVSQIGGGYGFTGFTTKNTTLNTTAGVWRIGLRVDGQAPIRGYLCEFILYNSALNTQQRQVVEAYLARKWNIPLPTTHPYYSTPVV